MSSPAMVMRFRLLVQVGEYTWGFVGCLFLHSFQGDWGLGFRVGLRVWGSGFRLLVGLLVMQ